MSNKKGLFALSPLMVFVGAYLSLSLAAGDFYKVPLTVAFMVASVYAIAISGGLPLAKRVDRYSRGASTSNLMLMLWIFVLAGAFAQSAKEMGSVDATVHLTLAFLPGNMLLAGLFVASCFISLSIGTSVGTIVALSPIATGLAASTGSSTPLMVAVVIGGAFFGDNLSFISDTTIVATQSQHCRLSDKFRVNLYLALPAALLTLAAYIAMGSDIHSPSETPPVEYVKVIPYLVVLLTAIFGMNVMAVLTLGLLLTGVIGMFTGSYDLLGWLSSMGAGITNMGELIIITMMAGGLLEIIRSNGGIDYIIEKLTNHVSGKRGAELSIAALVSVVNVCTANNTVAILTVGDISKSIGDRFGLDNRKCASILDTFSCCVQGLLPYGAQVLMGAGLSQLNPIEIIPNLYYPMVLGVVALLAILLRYPRSFS
ncbi:MAG: Na+/H+ antiporter NhaC family protein [Prevotella sp.]|nr:Na+/H+ antiporter NhaC family protein [Prevotella sp.]